MTKMAKNQKTATIQNWRRTTPRKRRTKTAKPAKPESKIRNKSQKKTPKKTVRKAKAARRRKG
jgi:hypothetical protein